MLGAEAAAWFGFGKGEQGVVEQAELDKVPARTLVPKVSAEVALTVMLDRVSVVEPVGVYNHRSPPALESTATSSTAATR